MIHCHSILYYCKILSEYMDSNISCTCKGIRTCLVCESQQQDISRLPEQHGGFKFAQTLSCEYQCYKYCLSCDNCHPVSDLSLESLVEENCCLEPVIDEGTMSSSSIHVQGILVIPAFVSEVEETDIITAINTQPWMPSQSGRFKQDYGPRVNFKKRRVKFDTFTGLPEFSGPLYEKLREVPELSDFVPIEQCHLEYRSERGAAIDQHHDDWWLWGERLVTLNLLESSALTLTLPGESRVVFVPLLRRSLLVLQGEARYRWQHGIERLHIEGKRVAVTLRELSREFASEQSEVSERLTQTALSSLKQNSDTHSNNQTTPRN